MPGVVGREAELKAVDAFLDGTAQALAIVGEPGIGKTTVWRDAVERARARGATVLVARPAESEVRLSFGGVADLTSALPAEAFDSLPAPQRRGLDVALLRADSAGPPARRVVATALLTLLRELAAESAVVVAIDDLQWLDPPSAVALEFALRRLEDENVRVIFSMRTDAAEPAALATERIEIGPLSVAALHRILSDATGRTFARPVLIRIAEASAGNPFHAIEIARELERRGVQDSIAPLPVPDSLGALVRARVRALPAPTRDALLRAAALTRPDTDLVDQTALAAAEEVGLVSIDASGRVRFTHPLFASAVYAAAATTRRRAVHRDLAAVVADPTERAHHLALASDGPDPDVVAELESAAQHARSHAAPDMAASLLELALRHVPAGRRGVTATPARACRASVSRERLRAGPHRPGGTPRGAHAGRPPLARADGARRDRLLAQGRVDCRETDAASARELREHAATRSLPNAARDLCGNGRPRARREHSTRSVRAPRRARDGGADTRCRRARRARACRSLPRPRLRRRRGRAHRSLGAVGTVTAGGGRRPRRVQARPVASVRRRPGRCTSETRRSRAANTRRG